MISFAALVLLVTHGFTIFAFQPKSPIGPYTGSTKPAPEPHFVIMGPDLADPDSTNAEADSSEVAPRG